MDQETQVKRLMAVFLEELPERVKALNDDVLALEKDPSGGRRAALLQSLFRTAHSLKGAAQSVNVDLIERACHQLEEILSAARAGRTTLGPEQFALLLKAADAVEEAAMRLREQQDLSGGPLAELLPRLEAAAASVSASFSPLPRTRGRGAEGKGAESGEASPPHPQPLSPEYGGEGGKRLSPEADETEEEEPRRPAASDPPPEPSANTVRVAAEKLDAFLARNGELLVARRRVQMRGADVRALRDSVGRWKTEWRAVEKPLAKFLRGAGLDSAAGPTPPHPEVDAALPRRAARALAQVGDNLRQLEKDLERLSAAVAADGRILKDAAGAVDDEVRRVRLFPFAEACEGLERIVRDLAHASGKEVELIVEGGDVEMDRSVLEGLKDPLRHLVRNAVDHGVESPEERRAAGKRRRARLTVAAVVRGAVVEVTVADDGRGVDLEALRRQVRKRRLPEPADEPELLRLLFLPGLSTAALITDVSGRGVGLDVVKSRVEALHGSVAATSEWGRGVRFTLAAPLTLTTLRVLLLKTADQVFALPAAAVQKLVRIEPEKLRWMEGRQMLTQDGAPTSLVSLAETLGLPGREAPRPGGKALAVIAAVGELRAAFLVDELIAEQEVVVKGLGARVRRLRLASAGTILPSGRIAPVLNPTNLLRAALQRTASAALPAAGEASLAKAKKRILVVDDSVTTRTLEKSILEAAGYDVTAAADGDAAWRLLQERGADLLVSDVDMPRMDGFELTEAVRRSPRFRDLPVVLVTARESEEDRARGVAVRADAYLGKSAFDQRNLLSTIAQLL